MADVRVYWLEPRRIASDRARIVRWLTAEERVKLAGFATGLLADEYLATRALVRVALTREQPAIAPAQWTFGRTAHGKPFVVGPEPRLSFNLSNQPGLVACAVTAGRALLGVDVEDCARGERLLAAAANVFAPPENATLAKLPREDRATRATTSWAMKEACLKASGEGIAFRLHRLAIERDPGGREIVTAAPESFAKYRIDIHHELLVTETARYVVAAALLREVRARHVLEPPSMRLIEVSWLLIP